jgi:hypothetical protein
MAKKSREEIDHYVLDQYEQEKHLGIGHERTKNLGRDWRESEIEKNPARPLDYEGGPAARVINEPRSQGVYGKFADPKDGTSRQENLDRWASYAKSNSYHRGPGPGVYPTTPDPRGRHTNESDGYLLSTKGWANLPDAGSESGEGRLQKSGKR